MLEFAPTVLKGMSVINSVPLDAYLQGVVPAESPASWPAEALKAQAIAARTYAITTAKSDDFDHYADTRSQVYKGVGIETAATNAAVADTRGQVVTYNGQPVVTYFFSTSGGKTEDVENTTLGNAPEPWLKSVDDEYDGVSPRHRWTMKLTMAQAARKLGGLVRGTFKGIKVTRRGASPRIMSAEIVGSKGLDDDRRRRRCARSSGSSTPGRTSRRSAARRPRPMTARPLRTPPAARRSRRARSPSSARTTSACCAEPWSAAARAASCRSFATGAGPTSPQVRLRHGAYRYAAPEAGTYRAVFGAAAVPPVRLG